MLLKVQTVGKQCMHLTRQLGRTKKQADSKLQLNTEQQSTNMGPEASMNPPPKETAWESFEGRRAKITEVSWPIHMINQAEE